LAAPAGRNLPRRNGKAALGRLFYSQKRICLDVAQGRRCGEAQDQAVPDPVPRRTAMWKLAAILHILIMTVLMGVLVAVIASMPSLMENAKVYIPASAVIGFILGLPFSVLLAKKILAQTRGA
jgi:gamma-glutamyl phosphate reductase